MCHNISVEQAQQYAHYCHAQVHHVLQRAIAEQAQVNAAFKTHTVAQLCDQPALQICV